MRLRRAGAAAGLLLLLAPAATAVAAGPEAELSVLPTAAAASPEAELSVLHLVPRHEVDVLVDGVRVLDDLQPGDRAGPVALRAGSRSVTLASSQAGAASQLGVVDVDLAQGARHTLVTHLSADGVPRTTVHAEPRAPGGSRDGRLTVRHVAATGPVDVALNGRRVMSSLRNAREQVLDLPDGSAQATVSAAGSGVALADAVEVAVRSGAAATVYLWGSPADGTFAVLVDAGAPATSTGTTSAGTTAAVGQPALLTEPVGPTVPAWSYAVAALVVVLVVALVGRSRPRVPDHGGD